MLRYCANLTHLFQEYPFLERFEAAADAGFSGVEVLFPYDDAATEIVRRLNRAGLPLVLINTPPPNWTGGARGFAAIPGGESRFKTDFRRTMRYAQRLQPQHIHIMAGKASGPDAYATFVENLKWAAQEAPKQSLLIEPINSVDAPGYFLDSFELAAGVLAEVNMPNVALQFDAYHAQMISGNVLKTWNEFGHLAKHIQVAGVPGRNEPMGGDIDYPAFYSAIKNSDFKGFVSGEYNPVGRTAEGLDWMKA